MDLVKAGVTNSQVIFTVRSLPLHGVLFVSDTSPPQTNVVWFTMSDLRLGRVTYLHDCSENSTDLVQLELRFHDVASLPDVPADLLLAHNFTLPVRVVPVNDRPTLVLPANDTLVLIVQTHLRLTSELLRAVDPDDPPDNLEFDVATNQSDGSYFAMGSGNVSRFSQADVDAGRVRLVQRGGPVIQYLSLRVTDGRETSDARRLGVIGVVIRLRAVRNTGLVVRLPRSPWAIISSDNLTFTCGAVHQNVDVRYEMTSSPRHGLLERRHGGQSEWRPATTFTQVSLPFCGKKNDPYLYKKLRHYQFLNVLFKIGYCVVPFRSF